MYSFEQICDRMELQGMPLPEESIRIQITDARKKIEAMMAYFLSKQKRELVWLPEYDELADWLSDNKGRGLFLYGQCGRGKSILCRYVLPALILQHTRKVVTVLDMQQLNKDIDTALGKHLLTLDDVGVEQQSVKYGERRLAFAEIMDAVEKNNKLVLVSSNLTVEDIRQRYGERTLDRIKGTTRRILFRGESLRK